MLHETYKFCFSKTTSLWRLAHLNKSSERMRSESIDSSARMLFLKIKIHRFHTRNNMIVCKCQAYLIFNCIFYYCAISCIVDGDDCGKLQKLKPRIKRAIAATSHSLLELKLTYVSKRNQTCIISELRFL